MTTGYQANVVPNTPILSAWGNLIRDRTVMVFASIADRGAAIAAPQTGMTVYVVATATLYSYDGTAWRSTPPAGSLMPFAGAAAQIPAGWLAAAGALVSRTTYADLFAAIGTLWGAGDGSTTFALPNMTGRVPAGSDAGAAVTPGLVVVGATPGAAQKILALAELPANMSITTYASGATNNTANRVSGMGTGGAGVGSSNTTIGLGNGNGFSLVQPSAAVSYIIKV